MRNDALALLNVNVPDLAPASLRGAIATYLSGATFLTGYMFQRDAHDADLVTMTRQEAGSPDPKPWSDAWAVKRGFVPVAPLHLFGDAVSGNADAIVMQPSVEARMLASSKA